MAHIDIRAQSWHCRHLDGGQPRMRTMVRTWCRRRSISRQRRHKQSGICENCERRVTSAILRVYAFYLLVN